jgi:hypothetical protein
VFTLPKLDEAEDLKPILDEALKRHGELAKIADDKITDEELEELEVVASGITEINAAQVTRDAAAADRAQRIAAAKQLPESATADETTDAETDAADVDADAEAAAAAAAVEIPNDASELVDADQKETVVASAAPARKSVARQVAANTAPAKRTTPTPVRPTANIVASGEGTGVAMGSKLPDMSAVAEAFLSKSRSMPQRKLAPGVSIHHGIASFQKATTPEFSLISGDQQGNFDKITQASIAQSAGGNLVAAGGWCAPSETIYDIPQLATVDGVLSLPEVSVPRGGLSFTKGPSFEQIYADSGFLQTETQAEAGDLKNFIDVECPGFEEVRLDVIGFGVRAGILTNKAWPELVRHYLDETLVAHAHKRNASMINRVVALSGQPITAGALGAVVADSLDALAMQATRLRYKYRLAVDARIEGIAPLWLVEVMRSDIAYREGTSDWSITDAQINAALAARNIFLQWVYDWQDLSGNPFPTGQTTGAAAPWPDSADVILYPTGAFIAGTEDVISLDIVHDTASLATNTFTAAFFEEAIMVFNPKANAVRVRLAVSRPAGRVGAANITNGFAPRPALPAAA